MIEVRKRGLIASFRRFCLAYFLLSAGGGQHAAARTIVRIDRVEADGLIQALPDPSVRSVQPLRLRPHAQNLILSFSEETPEGVSPSRLRYRLNGFDAAWRDLTSAGGMQVAILAFDAEGGEIGGETASLAGDTPGWKGSPENSDFIPRVLDWVVPDHAVSIRVTVRTGGGDIGIGVLAVDAVRLRVDPVGSEDRRLVDLGLRSETGVQQPTGKPDNWRRGGSAPSMARLSTVPTTDPRPMLVIVDNSSTAYAAWISNPIPVRPGDRLRLECNLAHTIGAAGPGSAVYPRLDPGTYWFRAVAARTDGGLNGPESTLRIVILPPLYQRAGFWLAMAVAGSAAAAGVGRIATRRRMQRTIDEIERREAMEHERARIARDLHDDIGAGLTEIAMQADRVRSAIAAGSPDDAIRRIGLVCRSAVDLTRSVDEIVWAVNPANDTLDRFANYTMNYATQFLDAAGLHARFDIPAAPMPIPLPGRVRHALFMAVREALNNAAKHAGANTIHVDLRVENGWLHVVIADDGRGFEPTGDLAAGLHEGIESMKRRMKEIGGIVILTSQPGEGSRVEFRLPLADAVPGDQS